MTAHFPHVFRVADLDELKIRGDAAIAEFKELVEALRMEARSTQHRKPILWPARFVRTAKS